MQFTTTAISTAALLATIQFTPAPPLAAAIFGGVVTLIGGITDVAIHASDGDKRDISNIVEVRNGINSHIKRVTPARVSDTGPNALAWQECVSQLAAPGVTVTFSYPEAGCKYNTNFPH